MKEYTIKVFKNGQKPTINGKVISDKLADIYSMIDMNLKEEDDKVEIYTSTDPQAKDLFEGKTKNDYSGPELS